MGFEWYQNFEFEVGNQKGVDTSMDGWSLTGNLKGYALTGPLQPYGLFGFGVLDFDEEVGPNESGLVKDRIDDFATMIRFGVGIDWYPFSGPFYRDFLVNLEAGYVMPFGNLEDLAFIPIGASLQYRFNLPDLPLRPLPPGE